MNHPAVGRPHDDRRASDADHDGRAVDRFKRSWPRPAASSTILIDFAADMDAAEALTFARKNPHAVLATMKRDGTPQLSPVLVGVDSKDRLVISTRESAMKTLNVRRDPRAWLCVLNDSFFGDWVQLSGDVEVVSLPSAMEPLVEYYRSISGEHPDWEDYRAAMLLDPGNAEEYRSDRIRLKALSTGPVKNRVCTRVTTNDGRSSQTKREIDRGRYTSPWVREFYRETCRDLRHIQDV